MTIRTPLPAIASAIAIAALALTACSADVDPSSGIGYKMTFADYTDAAGNWKEDIPAWVPEDALNIRVRAVNNGATIILRVDTRTKPLGEDCAEGPRETAPDLGASWIPAKLPETVLHCGGYEIITVDGGLLGWYIAPVPTPEPTTEPTTEG